MQYQFYNLNLLSRVCQWVCRKFYKEVDTPIIYLPVCVDDTELSPAGETPVDTTVGSLTIFASVFDPVTVRAWRELPPVLAMSNKCCSSAHKRALFGLFLA